MEITDRAKTRQRIAGAMVIAALGIIALAVVMDIGRDSQGPWRTGDNEIPPKPEQGFVTRVLPLEEWSGQARREIDAGKQEAAALPPPPARAPVPEPAPATAAPPATSGWVVQIASLSNEKSAEGLREKLRAQGYKVFIERGGTAWRVRIGPESTRERADALRAEVEKKTGMKGLVQQYP